MTDTWQVPEPTLTDDDVVVAKAAAPYEQPLSVDNSSSFKVADHLDDRVKTALLELAKNVI